MEPTLALQSIETALRLVIREILGDTWRTAKGAPDIDKLEGRRTEDVARRDGTLTSDDLLDFTETYHLADIIEKNWESFVTVFDDKKRTTVYFDIIKDVRNTIAHSRELVTFERDLLSGIAGQLRNQISIFRNSQDGSRQYYPRIESLRDGLGREAGGPSIGAPSKQRVDVGDTIDFIGSAFAARGKPVSWSVRTSMIVDTVVGTDGKVADGNDVSFSYTFTESDVAEDVTLFVYIKADSKYRRLSYSASPECDDYRFFRYAVNPPD